jgi:hypothetical protein
LQNILGDTLVIYSCFEGNGRNYANWVLDESNQILFFLNKKGDLLRYRKSDKSLKKRA